MATTLLLYLILNMHRRGTGFFQAFDRSGDVEGASPARIDIDQQGQGAGISDTAHVDENVIQRCDAKIGQAAGAGRYTAAGQVERLKSRVFGQHSGIGVNGADDL